MRCLIHLGDAFYLPPSTEVLLAPFITSYKHAHRDPCVVPPETTKSGKTKPNVQRMKSFRWLQHPSFFSHLFFLSFLCVCLKNNSALTARINALFNKGDNNIPLYYRPSSFYEKKQKFKAILYVTMEFVNRQIGENTLNLNLKQIV